MSLLYGATGTTKLEGIAAALSGQDVGVVLVLAVVLVGAGMGFKIAAVPFHMWAPDVYEGAPTPVTAFLSVGSKAASFAMLLRIFFEGLPALAAEWKMLFWVLAVVTMTVGNIAALTQSNLKRMLAYSSIAHALFTDWRGRWHRTRRGSDARVSGGLPLYAAWRIRHRDGDAAK